MSNEGGRRHVRPPALYLVRSYPLLFANPSRLSRYITGIDL